MNKIHPYLICILTIVSLTLGNAQHNINDHQEELSPRSAKDMTMFIFGHSLINHEFQVNPTPSQETSVPHWLHFLSEEADNDFKVSGQYGFLPQHANLPPISQWGFDVAAPAWESDYDPFTEADFTHIMMTPGNFIQWQGPEVNYPNDNISPLVATNNIIQWCAEQENDLQFYIYENWPDMAPFLGADFPPAGAEWIAYNEYLQSDFVEWFEDYHNQVKDAHADKCISLIPVGRLISEALSMFPFSDIEISNLYEDDAPHGRPTIYFLASMITYMAVYEEPTPSTYQVDEIIDPIVAENYLQLIDFFWEKLLTFNDDNGESKVFCKSPTAISNIAINENQIEVYPHPITDQFFIKNISSETHITLHDHTGRLIDQQLKKDSSTAFDASSLTPGIYYLKTYNQTNDQSSYSKIIKI